MLVSKSDEGRSVVENREGEERRGREGEEREGGRERVGRGKERGEQKENEEIYMYRQTQYELLLLHWLLISMHVNQCTPLVAIHRQHALTVSMCVCIPLTALYRSYLLQVHIVTTPALSSHRPHPYPSNQFQYTPRLVRLNLHVHGKTRLTGIRSIDVRLLYTVVLRYHFHLVGVTYVESGRGPAESKSGRGIRGM